MQCNPRCWRVELPDKNNRLTFPNTAVMLLIMNRGGSEVLIRLNDDYQAEFTLPPGEGMNFARDEVHITSLLFQGKAGGICDVIASFYG